MIDKSIVTLKEYKSTNRVFVWLAISLVIALGLGYQIFVNVQQNQSLANQLEEVKKEEQQVRVSQMELQAKVDLLQQDQYVLKLARSRGFFSLQDEIIFNIPEKNALLLNEKARQESLQTQETTQSNR